MATHSQCQPRPHPFSPTATPPLLLVEESPGGQRVSVPQPPRHGAVCPPPPPPLLPFQFAPRLQQTQPRIRVTSAHVSQKSDPSGKPYFPLTGNIFHFSPEPKRLSVPRLRVSRPESQKNQRKTNRRVGGGGIEEPSFCHLDNLVCKPFGMSLLQQVYSG